MALDENGLTVPRLPDVLDDIVDSQQTNIDPNISTSDDELLGQLNNILAAKIAEVFALAESVNDNFNPDKAEGKNLDDLVNLFGIKRSAATSSSGTQQFSGDDGVTVPSGTIVRNPVTLDRIATTEAISLSVSDCISAKYSVNTLSNNTLYTITVNATDYDFTSDGDATNLEILNGLKALIDADGSATWTATVDTTNEQIEIATSDSNNIAISSTVNIGPDEVTNDGAAEAEETGAILFPSNTITELVTIISGVNSSTNPSAYSLGRDEETDEELRLRFLSSQQVAGVATVPAIEDSVRNVEGVTSASVIENRSLTTDGDGRPGKSFETVVQGGTDEDVAQKIWETKPAGIETHGNTAIQVLDSTGNPAEDILGNPINVNFTRPVAINLALRITYTLYDEESFPSDGETVIQDTVVDFTNNLGVDKDVIPPRYFGPIFDAVSGIETLVVEVQQITNPGDTPDGGSWQTTTLPIAFDEFASTTSTDITIVAA